MRVHLLQGQQPEDPAGPQVVLQSLLASDVHQPLPLPQLPLRRRAHLHHIIIYYYFFYLFISLYLSPAGTEFAHECWCGNHCPTTEKIGNTPMSTQLTLRTILFLLTGLRCLLQTHAPCPVLVTLGRPVEDTGVSGSTQHNIQMNLSRCSKLNTLRSLAVTIAVNEITF